MNDYEARQEARRQRLLNRADRLHAISNAKYHQAQSMGEMIPFGQPILVGHHSEHRDRRFRARIWSTMGASVEAGKKADEAEQRAASVGSAGISSDDPDALRKLEAKLERLVNLQSQMKAVNQAHALFLKNPVSLDSSTLSEQMKDLIRKYIPAYSWEAHPFAPYTLTNNNAEIRRVKVRINSLQKAAAFASALVATTGEAAREMEYEGFTYREDHHENRVMFIFPEIPAKATREALKAEAFKWSPTRRAWVRLLNNAGRYAAKCVIRKITPQE